MHRVSARGSEDHLVGPDAEGLGHLLTRLIQEESSPPGLVIKPPRITAQIKILGEHRSRGWMQWLLSSCIEVDHGGEPTCPGGREPGSQSRSE